ncbi:hypothetical protein J5295_02125 [Riemerella anatipestifer]|uniref:Uncharacterized protein n=2 Tax=Riemerella anatipestifer TaxID=34085 RepID=E4TBF9_RIEAD|nr:hypothetical protein [Riemerella anatipestifer]ADQ81463.1 hypothetical protein Riean_0292 [Riemerella anatipestifer ATCC 11845 = DSM 15868]AFD55479.1 hypothetical protein RA0C_0501 [Riemerella anatipestifer ATCC 11845 = DSM 15868]AGC40640.1 hypothetical protein G148_1336 [Riemerella anatipestifer RA-CH-2]AKP68739.1 hypothetical protein CG08_0315 [Riemerella anatipestifer]AKP70583.1 hypothetical protein CG09_0305 [Riemerella anatipestifer]
MCYLISFSEVREIFKLPILIEHFVEHRNDNSEMSFGQFITLHYFSGDVHDDDYEEDMKLPFKSQNQNISASIVLAMPASFDFKIKSSKIYKEKSQNFGYSDSFTIDNSDLVFHPPRLV